MLHRCLALLLALLIAGPAAGQAIDEARLQAFAREMRLVAVDDFVDTVKSLRSVKRLPSRYMTKTEAERVGWQPGSDLCRVARGRAIGGDRFGNLERRLPTVAGRTWREADLDFNCGRRGPKRLVFSSDGLIYVTTDHYQSFREVPR